MFLFKVSDKFNITGRGLLLTGGEQREMKFVKPGDQIQLIKPDNTKLYSRITGITFGSHYHIIIENGINKSDIPHGTEVWLINSNLPK